MRDLGAVREGWEAHDEEETRLLRDLPVADGVRQWLALQRSFESQLQETMSLFAQDRWAALAELQARLRRLVRS